VIWNEWRVRNPDSLPDLGEANLSQEDLSMANLSRADLSGANLVMANLINANLSGANLSMANLSAANLSGATLQETVFGDVDLKFTLGLDFCTHSGASVVDFRTLSRSGNLPINFLRGCGLPDTLIEYLPSFRGDAIRFYPVSSVTRQKTKCSLRGFMPTCRTPAFGAGSRRTICPSAPRPGMRLTRRSAYGTSCL
jgi:hypothetical protein